MFLDVNKTILHIFLQSNVLWFYFFWHIGCFLGHMGLLDPNLFIKCLVEQVPWSSHSLMHLQAGLHAQVANGGCHCWWGTP